MRSPLFLTPKPSMQLSLLALDLDHKVSCLGVSEIFNAAPRGNPIFSGNSSRQPKIRSILSFFSLSTRRENPVGGTFLKLRKRRD